MISKDKFDKLVFNPFDKEDEDMDEELRLGSLVVPFDGILDITPKKDVYKLSRYILYMYDAGTPLMMLYPDVRARKKEASLLAGYDEDKEQEKLDRLYALDDDRVKALVLQFVKWQNSMDWGMMVSQEQLFWATNAKIMETSDLESDKDIVDVMGKKAKLVEACHKLSANVDSLRMSLSRKDDTLEKKIIEATKFTPEKIAKAFRNKKVVSPA